VLGEAALGIFCVFTLIGWFAWPIWDAALFGLASVALAVLGLVLILPLFWLVDRLETRSWQ
jgi:hypothetical protein